MSRLLVVAGTGTEIGKTHVSEALLHALNRRGIVAVGFKPVETGLASGGVSDAMRLASASAFHVEHSRFEYEPALSPHLAARDAGQPIALEPIATTVATLKQTCDWLVVELAGGLFTPLAPPATNADLARALDPDATILVAPDRLGVLHDVVATYRAASTVPVRLDAVLLSAVSCPDPSSGRNLPELLTLVRGVPMFSVPRGEPQLLSRTAGLLALVDHLLRRSQPGDVSAG